MMDHDDEGGSGGSMKVVDDRDGRRSEAAVVEFGMEITNTESPVGSKRSLADTGENTTTTQQTPPKRQKRRIIVDAITTTPVVTSQNF